MVHQPEKDEPWIPPFIENFNEPADEKRSRLMYQSRKRGMLENGLLLGRQASFTEIVAGKNLTILVITFQFTHRR